MPEIPPPGEPLSPRRRLVIGAFTLALAGFGFAGGRVVLRPPGFVRQPIAFSHRKHVAGLGLECSVCHEHYATGAHSGLPTLATCLGCHEEPLTDSAAEKELRALAKGARPPAFEKLFRLPDHVYYSHRRHVTVARLECETCHGAIADSEAPPSRPLVRITMDTCLGCHAIKGVNTGCAHCHR